ncbi:MAG: sulfotransferase [Gammaproteobacteria bacterium]|nr:sulfotransferase [Gammaproteobacteria bacterium]MDH5262316.1 sulfotransferase [Gammaproteobacteria bacterium]MDH5620651.1 sulfotransferase [Gammaproteobacteria bacterium]
MTSQQSVRLQQAMHAHSAGKLAFAEAEYRALIAAKAKTPQLYSQLALVCAQTARREEADHLWRLALGLDRNFLDAQMNLADSYQQAGDPERAAKLYRRVIAAHKHLHIARYLLANILKSQGKLDEASDLYKEVMAQQPDYTQAHFTYSGIHKYEDSADPHIDTMLRLYERAGLATGGRIHLAFALAKAYEDIGDYSEAFSYLKSGNELRFAEFNYDIESDKALMQSIMSAFTPEAMSRVHVNADASARPIFIVGMPRSGTSLVEKIIASHSEVYGAGELHNMFALGTQYFLRQSGDFQFQALDSYAPETFETVGRAYLEQIAVLNSDASRVTDKLPFNMMMAGLIRLALPNARIIHCVRDAKDNCLSIFKQNFTTANYRFAYNLKTIAQFHNQYRALMRHWREAMPGAIYDVSYESLARDPEAEIRKLLEACDLDFQERCVRFEKTEAVVRTASAVQVRQPMYTSSVGLWEKYSQFLGPMLEELADD